MKDVTKKATKDETKTNKKKDVKKKENKKTSVKQESFFTGVRKEMKKVRWPLKSEMIKYSIATLSFFFGIFFTLGDLIIAGLKMLVG